MAIVKAILQEDGVTTSYHRILFIQSTVNRQNSIAVLSYVDENARLGEKNGTIAQPYSKSKTYETSYSESMNTPLAYEYLKTLPDFEGATDI